MIDVQAVAALVHQQLENMGLTRVKGRVERWTFTPEKQSDVYLEVGTVYGEVRIRVYAHNSLLGRYNVLREDQVPSKVDAAFKRGHDARVTQAQYAAGD